MYQATYNFSFNDVIPKSSNFSITRRSVSTRMAAGVWWFFTLIMVSCYTANLAAFLTIESPIEDFTNIEELAQNTRNVKYGAKLEGTTLKFFNVSK